MSNADTEGRVIDDEAHARRTTMIPALLEAARHELAEELDESPDVIDWQQLDDGRYVVRAEGFPMFVADVSSLDADARLTLDSEDDALGDGDAVDGDRDVECATCGAELDRDCDGDVRCVECDGPCPGCHSGPAPGDELRCSRCDRDELLYPEHPDATSSRIVCVRCDVELDDDGNALS